MQKLYAHSYFLRPDGTKDTFHTQAVEYRAFADGRVFARRDGTLHLLSKSMVTRRKNGQVIRYQFVEE